MGQGRQLQQWCGHFSHQNNQLHISLALSHRYDDSLAQPIPNKNTSMNLNPLLPRTGSSSGSILNNLVRHGLNFSWLISQDHCLLCVLDNCTVWPDWTLCHVIQSLYAGLSTHIFNRILDDWPGRFNALAPGRFAWNFRWLIFKFLWLMAEAFLVIALGWMSQDPIDDKSLVQVMAWCHQAKSHYLSQWWPRSMSPYSVTSSGNGLVPSGNKLMLEPILIQIYGSIWHN